MIVAVLKNKYLANLVGPSGFGEFGILNSFFSLVAIFSSGWLAQGVIKFISEYKNDINTELYQHILIINLKVSVSLSVIIAVLFLILPTSVIKSLTSDKIHYTYFIICCLGFVWLNVNQIMFAFYQGIYLLRKTFLAKLLSATVDIILYYFLVKYLFLLGMFLAFSISSFTTSLVLLFGQGRSISRHLRIKILAPETKLLFKKIVLFGIANLLPQLTYLLTMYLIRYIVVDTMSLYDAGLLQAAFAITGFLGIATRGADFYYLSKMSEKLPIAERNIVTNEYLQFSLIINIPLTIISIIFSREIIHLLFNKNFDSLNNVLYLFIFFQFLANIASTFHNNLVGLGKMKTFAKVSILGNALIICMTLLFIHQLGLFAIGLGFIACYCMSISTYFIYFNKTIHYTPNKEQVILLSLSILLIAFSIVSRNYSFIEKCFCATFILLPVLYYGKKHYVLITREIANIVKK